MRSWFTATCAVGFVFCGPLAFAEDVADEALPLPPAIQATPVTPSTTTTTTVTTSAAPPVQVAPAPPYLSVPAPPVPPALPAPQGAVQGPMYYNGPVWVIPAPVMGQPMTAPPALPPPPYYRAWPQQRYRTASCCTLPPQRYVVPKGPVFAIGLTFTTLGIRQSVFGQDMNMLGGGLQLRFRTQGHWGFETEFDIARANINSGAFIRNSYPFTAAAMLYIFQNRPQNHFNIFFLAGAGLMADTVTLFDSTPQQHDQRFLELLGQAGGGIELRFTRLALSADIRAIGLALDQSSPSGAYYSGVDGGPIPSSSIGYKVNAGALVWF